MCVLLARSAEYLINDTFSNSAKIMRLHDTQVQQKLDF